MREIKQWSEGSGVLKLLFILLAAGEIIFLADTIGGMEELRDAALRVFSVDL